MPERLVTTAEAARELGVSDRTLARWTRDGRVKPASTTLGGHYRWNLDELRAQIRQLQERDER